MAYRADANTTQRAWDSKLVEDSSTHDIFSDFEGVFMDDTRQVPEAIMIKVNAVASENERTLTLLKYLSGNGVTGNTPQIGNEEEQVLKTMVVFANSFSHAVNIEKFGIEAFRVKAYNLMAQLQPQLSRWRKETVGRYTREALCEQFSSNLLDTPVSKTASINPNLFFVGEGFATYNNTLATYVTNINTKAPGSPTTANQASVAYLQRIEATASSSAIEPIHMGGKDWYFHTIPTRQKLTLFKPSSDSYFELAKDGDFRGTQNRAFQFQMKTIGHLILVEDQRAPIMTVTGGTVVFSYKGAGDTDGRNLLTDVTRFDVGFLLGKGAVYRYVMEEAHFEEEHQAYGKNKGVGIFQTEGYTGGWFDDVTPTATSIQQKTSIVIAFASSPEP